MCFLPKYNYMPQKYFRLSIIVSDSNPQIIRILQIASDAFFIDLHECIMVLMDWTDKKVFSFRTVNLIISDTEIMTNADADVFETRLSEYLIEEGLVIEYVYGDEQSNWEFEIVLSEIVSIEEANLIPICLDGKMSAAPEDLPDIAFYNELVEIYFKENHERHDEAHQKLKNDPYLFDIEAINIELKALFIENPLNIAFVNIPAELAENDNAEIAALALKQITLSKKMFEQYKQTAEKAMAQVKDEFLFVQVNIESNSIAAIVKHLWGNMLSRWTDFLHSDGEKEWRDRDSEFENDLKSRDEMMEKWQEGWQVLFMAIDELEASDWDKSVIINKHPQWVGEAIQRQLMHYAYHVGQIVLLCKLLNQGTWETLSIPRKK
jgi:hypothetical protein